MSTRLKDLKEQVLEANLELVREGLVISTFGNASGILRGEDLVAIKPSGVNYHQLRSQDLIVTNLKGDIIEGTLRPSSDLPTHLELYRSFPVIGGVTHTHSRFATAWAQARREIPCLGTTHADYFFGPVPITPSITSEEIESDYEANTGKVIARRFEGLDPAHFPGVLVASHGPFSWGSDSLGASHNAVLLEEIARIAWYTLTLNPGTEPVSRSLLEKHFQRKHGPEAYYGQK